MKKVNFLMLLLLTVTLLVSCNKKQEELFVEPQTTGESKKQAEASQSGNANARVNTNSRRIIGQLFSEPNFRGRVHTLSSPGSLALSRLPFRVRSMVVTANAKIIIHGPREERAFVGNRQRKAAGYYPNVNFRSDRIFTPTSYNDITLGFDGYNSLSVDVYDQSKRYVGQLRTSNGYQIPIFNNLKDTESGLGGFFNNGRNFYFNPASTSSSGKPLVYLHRFRNTNYLNSLMKAARVGGPRVNLPEKPRSIVIAPNNQVMLRGTSRFLPLAPAIINLVGYGFSLETWARWAIHGGHVLSRHYDKTEAFLRTRLGNTYVITENGGQLRRAIETATTYLPEYISMRQLAAGLTTVIRNNMGSLNSLQVGRAKVFTVVGMPGTGVRGPLGFGITRSGRKFLSRTSKVVIKRIATGTATTAFVIVTSYLIDQ